MTFFFDADNTDKDAEQAQTMIRREINSKMDCLKLTIILTGPSGGRCLNKLNSASYNILLNNIILQRGDRKPITVVRITHEPLARYPLFHIWVIISNDSFISTNEVTDRSASGFVVLDHISSIFPTHETHVFSFYIHLLINRYYFYKQADYCPWRRERVLKPQVLNPNTVFMNTFFGLRKCEYFVRSIVGIPFLSSWPQIWLLSLSGVTCCAECLHISLIFEYSSWDLLVLKSI